MLEIVLQQLRITLVILKLVFMKNKFLSPLGPYTLCFCRQFIWQNTEKYTLLLEVSSAASIFENDLNP